MYCDTVVDFLLNVGSTVAGGIFLAFLFFLLKEKVFPLPSVTGQWYFQMCTERTAYGPYRDMVLRYVAMLWCEGPNIRGTIEKTYENSSTGEREYIGKNRTRGLVEGYIEKNYFAKDVIYFHLIEDGHGRESTHFHKLHIQSSNRMSGRFSSMVADSSGEVVWQRESF